MLVAARGRDAAPGSVVSAAELSPTGSSTKPFAALDREHDRSATEFIPTCSMC